MDRFTISIDEELATAFDTLIHERGYATRSEAFRDILRGHLQQREEGRDVSGPCVAALSYIYSHHERELAERLTAMQHAKHDLTVSTMHAHLDHDECIETAILQGPARTVRRFAEGIIAERGVRHGQLNLISVAPGRLHQHGGKPHRHLKPRH